MRDVLYERGCKLIDEADWVPGKLGNLKNTVTLKPAFARVFSFTADEKARLFSQLSRSKREMGELKERLDVYCKNKKQRRS